MWSIWEYFNLDGLGLQQASNELERFKNYIAEKAQNAQNIANKIIRIERLQQEILTLASSTETYDDLQKLEELKCKAHELKDLKHEVNTHLQL